MLSLRSCTLVVLLAGAASAAGACATAVENPEPGAGGSGASGGSGGSNAGGGTSTATSTSTSTSTGAGPCVGADDCAAFDDACNVGTCINGACEKLPANDLGACDDGKACTQNDACQGGACSGTLKPCSSSDACHVASCDVVTDACVEVPGNDGAGCVDDDPCTLTAVCQSGVCMPGQAVDCSFLDGVCSTGACDPQLGCVAVPKNDGAPCDDGFYCTVGDSCTAGVCSGAPNTCAAPGDVCMIGSCNEATDSCVAVPGNDGAACNDNSPCTTGETCANGACGGGLPANPGAACDDQNACTVGETCTNNGTCGGGSAIVACQSGDGCCPPGCTLANDGDCAITRWSDGTIEWPDQACNPFNSFGFCDTNAQNHADAWATAVCQMNGYSSGVWTGNKIAGCAGEISMWCQGNIPCTPLYENSCAQGDQTQIEFTCFP